MSGRTVDRKIAEWLGWKPHPDGIHYYVGDTPAWIGGCMSLLDFQHSDQAAITLLPVLVDKGYYCKLEVDDYYDLRLWRFDISDGKGLHVKSTEHKTIASAITSAVIQLIEREETK